MKRDDDLVRDLLFRLEAEEDYLSLVFANTKDNSESGRHEFGHILLLADAGFVDLSGRGGDIVRLTNAGHDFIAAVRNDTTWSKTKDVAGKAGIATLGMMFEIAVAIGKQKLKEVTGWDF